MTDLRDKIAAVLVMHREDDVGELDCICGWEWAGYGLYADAYANHLADALIAAGVTMPAPKPPKSFSWLPGGY